MRPSLAALLLSACSLSDKMIRFGTAGEGGNYYLFGEAFAELLYEQDDKMEIEVKETAGSAANLRLLSGGFIQMGIAQADVLQDSYYGTETSEEEELIRGYGAIAGLYTEACHVVTREDAGISSIRDLQGKKICIGEAESGTVKNAQQILLAYGLNEKITEEVNMNYDEAAKAMLSGEIDALFCTSGIQTDFIEELAGETSLKFLPVEEVERGAILQTYDYYIPCTIPAGTYTGQEEDIETVGVRSVLLASDRISKKTVREITECLFTHADELEEEFSVKLPVKPEDAAKGIPVPLHAGAADYYESQGISTEAE